MADRTVKVNLRADVSDYQRSVNRAADDTDKLNRKADKFDGRRIRATAELATEKAERDAQKLSDDLSRLNLQRATPEAELKAANFRVQIQQIKQDIRELSQMDASADVDADIAMAEAKLRYINSQLERFDGQRFVATVDVKTSGTAQINLLASGIAALAPAAISAGAVGAGAIVGLSTTLVQGGVAAGVLMAAFKGMGDAIKAANAYALDPTKENLKAMQDEMKNLDSVSQNMVKAIGAWGPKLKEIQGVARAGMFPGMIEGLNTLQGLMPNVLNLTRNYSEALGQLAADGSKALTDPFWRSYFDFLGGEAKTTFTDFVQSMGNFTKGLAGMQMAFQPFARDMISGLEEMSVKFANWGSSLGTNAGFQEFLAYIRDVGPQVVATIGSIASMFGDIIQAALPVGPVMLTVIKAVADFVGWVARIPVVGTTLIALAAAMGTLTLASKALAATKLPQALAMMGAFGPAARSAQTGALAASMGMAQFGSAADKAEKSGTRAGGAMGKVGSALSATAKNLPIIGAVLIGAAVAWDQFNTSASEAATGLRTAGQAGAEMRKELAENDASLKNVYDTFGPVIGKLEEWNRSTFGTATTTKMANAEFERQVAAMTPLEGSYARVERAQSAYDAAVIQFGQNSNQAIAALVNLTMAQGDAEVQTQLANKSGKAYYDTLGQLAQAGGPAGDAARRLAAGLNFTEVAAIGASMKIGETGRVIATLPDGKTILLNTNASEASAQMQIVSAQVQALPVGKSINVGVLGEQAKSDLRGIGIQVQTLPNGDVIVTANTADAKAKLDMFVATAGVTPVRMALGLDTGPGVDARNLFKANTEGGPPIFAPFSVNTAPAIPPINDVRAQAAIPGAPMPLNVNTAPATGPIAGIKQQAAVPSIFDLMSNTGPANAATGQAHIEAAKGEIFTQGSNTAPAAGSTAGVHGQARIPEIFTQSSNTGPAAGSVAGVHGQARVPEQFTTNAETGGARGAIASLKSWASRAVSFVVNAVTGRSAGSIDVPGNVVFNDTGNMLSSSRINSGHGMKAPRSMPHHMAQMVQPNTWRVVGDRMDVPELFAPLDGSGRSLNLIAQGAATFGKALVDASSLSRLTGEKFRAVAAAQVPQRVSPSDFRAMAMAMAGSGSGGGVVNNFDVDVHNPRAERASDSIQRELAKMSSFGLFGEG